MKNRKSFLAAILSVAMVFSFVAASGMSTVTAEADNKEEAELAAYAEITDGESVELSAMEIQEGEDYGIETLALEDLVTNPEYPDAGTPSVSDLEWGVTHSKEATNLAENPDTGNLESTVTLRVSHDVDVVIVQDGTNLVNATDDLIKDLANQTDVHVSCGMVIFGGTAPICWTSEDVLDLSVGSNVEYLIHGLEEDAWEEDVLWNHSGSNLQAGLREAERMLEKDEKLTSSDKYIIFLSDCAARMWLNDDDEVMAKAYMIGDNQWFFDGTEDWIQRYGRWTDAYFDSNSDPSPDNILYAYPHTFQEVWNAGQGGAPIDDYTMTFEEWQAKRDAGDITGSVRITNAGSEPHSSTMEEYYASYEAATYHTAEEFIKAAGMANIELVTFSYYGYPLLQYNFGEYIDSFQEWLGDLDNITRYQYLESDEEGQLENESYIFEHILEQIRSTEVGQGVLIDEIGKTNEYDLDFIDEMERFHLIAGADEYPCTAIEPTEGATSAYGFGDANGSDDGTTYPFILRYYQDGCTYTDPYDGTTATYGECFAIEFNTTISGFYEYDDSEGILYNGVSFTYDIYLTNPQEETGVYGEYDQYGENDRESLYTNNIAVMYPLSASGTAEPKQVFPMPTVSYRSLEVEKVWEDEDDADGIRPDDITVELLKDGETTGKMLTLSEENGWKGGFAGLEIGPEGNEVASVTVTEGEDWSWVFDNLDKFDEDGTQIEYTFVEDPVDGYSTTVDGDTVINTYALDQTNDKTEEGANEVVPLAITKEDISGSINWYDGDDAEGNRPESVTVTLYENGNPVDSAEVSAAGGWSFDFGSSWEPLDDGGYTIEVSAADGYSITVDYSTFEIDTLFHTRYLTCTATYIAATDISGSVTWTDNENENEIRPDSITVYLLANGVQVTDENGDPVSATVGEADNWTWNFEGVDKYSVNGIKITYTVTVDEAGLEAYNCMAKGYNVICIESTSVSGSKVWNDGDNADGARPSEITIHIYEGRAPITYSVREVSDVDGYRSEVTGNQAEGFVVTNSHTPEGSIAGISLSGGNSIIDAVTSDEAVTPGGTVTSDDPVTSSGVVTSDDIVTLGSAVKTADSNAPVLDRFLIVLAGAVLVTLGVRRKTMWR